MLLRAGLEAAIDAGDPPEVVEDDEEIAPLRRDAARFEHTVPSGRRDELGERPFDDELELTGGWRLNQQETHLWLFFDAELLEQRERFRERLDALHRAVRHVRGRLALAVDGLHVGALRDEVLDHLDVAARRRVVQRGVALVVDGVDVGVELLDQVLRPRPASRSARSGASWRRSLRRSRRRPRPGAAARRGRRPAPAAAPTRPSLRGRRRRSGRGPRSAWSRMFGSAP